MAQAAGHRAGGRGRSLAIVGGLVLVAALATPLLARDGVRAQDSAGADLYRTNCAGCHQAGGEGIAGAFPPLAGNTNAADAGYVEGVIRDGLSGPIEVNGETYDQVMPAIPGLSDEDITEIATYVVGLAEGTPGGDDTGDDSAAPTETTEPPPPPEAPSAGDIDRGHDLFVGSDRLDNGGTACASCHTAGSVGNLGGQSLGPALDGTYAKFGGATALAAWLANPASPTMQPIFANDPMTEQEIADLVAFLADAPNQDAPDDSVDWLLIAGLIGLVLLLAGMAVGYRDRRRTYTQTLRSTR